METLIVSLALLLAGFAASDPIDIPITTIPEGLFREDFVVYTGENEITKIVVPVCSINFNTDIDNIDLYVFFIEAGKGLYVLKNNVTTKILDSGKDVASSWYGTQVFFGATDGIYTFNAEKKTAEKYGTLTDNIRNIVVTNRDNEIYILTEDKMFYKVTDEGTKKKKLVNVKDAKQIVLDHLNNMYYVDSQNDVYVRRSEDYTVRKINGLPAYPLYAELLRPPSMFDEGVPFVSGKKIYDVHANGTSHFSGLVLSIRPTAYAVEQTLMLHFAHDKKIYQYNIVNIMDSIMSPVDMMRAINSFMEVKAP